MSVQQPVLSEKKRKGNIVNETDNPAGNLPDCTKMPMTQNLADL